MAQKVKKALPDRPVKGSVYKGAVVKPAFPPTRPEKPKRMKGKVKRAMRK